MIHYDRYVTRMLVGLGPLLAASCLGEAYLEGVKLFPDGEASSSGPDAPSTSTTADLPTSTGPGDTGIQTATGALDEDSTTGTEPGPGTSTGSESTAGEVDNQPPGEFQDSCRPAIQPCLALESRRSGLRQTTRIGFQERVSPLQRSGWRRRAAA